MLSGSEGKAFITIDGKNRELFELLKISVNIEKTVAEKKLLGSRITQHKVTGLSIKGSATLALMNGALLDSTLKYLKTGVFPDIKLQIKNLDNASSVGAREAVLSGVIFNTDLISMLEGESEDIITFDTDLTADGIELLSDFTLPQNYR